MRFMLLLLLSFPAYATVWNIQDHLEDGSVIAGFFDIDDWGGNVNNWNFFVSSGSLSSFRYTPETSNLLVSSVISPNPNPVIAFGNDTRQIGFLVETKAIYQPGLGTYELVSNQSELRHNDTYEVQDFGHGKIIARHSTSGFITTNAAALVPEPSTALLLLPALTVLLLRSARLRSRTLSEA